MTVSVGAYEAKTHFSELLERVIRGETITVTRHGTPVAQLGPVDGSRHDDARRAVDGIRQMRSEIRLDGLNIKELMYEGRR